MIVEEVLHGAVTVVRGVVFHHGVLKHAVYVFLDWLGARGRFVKVKFFKVLGEVAVSPKRTGSEVVESLLQQVQFLLIQAVLKL